MDPPEVVVRACRCAARRVLVVDDNEDVAESLALYLGLTGHEVRTAANGAEALQAAREFRPEAIILDIGLPGLDGREVARRLRRDPDLASAVLLAVTGYAGEVQGQLCREAGFDAYLAKPADPEEVRRLLAGTCDVT
jgi:CheY-like chemotaxis protein